MMSSLRFSDVSSGAPALDRLHNDFFQALDVVSTSSDAEFSERYGAFVYQAEQIFREEERWMEEIDSPALKLHREQHARVLGALHNTHRRVMNGEIQLGRKVTDQLLPQWFALHASTLDASLAVAMTLPDLGHEKPTEETSHAP